MGPGARGKKECAHKYDEGQYKFGTPVAPWQRFHVNLPGLGQKNQESRIIAWISQTQTVPERGFWRLVGS
jgi:hypothetical protein